MGQEATAGRERREFARASLCVAVEARLYGLQSEPLGPPGHGVVVDVSVAGVRLAVQGPFGKSLAEEGGSEALVGLGFLTEANQVTGQVMFRRRWVREDEGRWQLGLVMVAETAATRTIMARLADRRAQNGSFGRWFGSAAAVVIGLAVLSQFLPGPAVQDPGPSAEAANLQAALARQSQDATQLSQARDRAESRVRLLETQMASCTHSLAEARNAPSEASPSPLPEVFEAPGPTTDVALAAPSEPAGGLPETTELPPAPPPGTAEDVP